MGLGLHEGRGSKSQQERVLGHVCMAGTRVCMARTWSWLGHVCAWLCFTETCMCMARTYMCMVVHGWNTPVCGWDMCVHGCASLGHACAWPKHKCARLWMVGTCLCVAGTCMCMTVCVRDASSGRCQLPHSGTQSSHKLIPFSSSSSDEGFLSKIDNTVPPIQCPPASASRALRCAPTNGFP